MARKVPKYQQFDRTTAPKEQQQQQEPEERWVSIADRFRHLYKDGIRY